MSAEIAGVAEPLAIDSPTDAGETRRRPRTALRTIARWARRIGVALWRSLRPYSVASWRHPPRGA
jgi:hypothetical protein